MTLPTLEACVPHRRPLLLPEAIVSLSERGCVTQLEVDPTAWYADENGAMPAWIGLELMAQSAAAFNGWQHRHSPTPKGGVLLGTRRFSATRPSFPAGSGLEIQAELDGEGIFGQSAFACRILLNGDPVAEATLRVLETTP